MVACNSLREYNNNKEKIKQFYLEEKGQAKQKQQQIFQGPSTSESRTPDGKDNLYSHDQNVSIAKNNQRSHQQKRRTNQKREVNVKKQQPGQLQPRKQVSTRRRSKHTMPPKNTQQENIVKRKLKQKPSDTFLAKSRAAALNQSRIHMEKQQNRSFKKINEEEILKSPTVEVITISDSTQNSPLKNIHVG